MASPPAPKKAKIGVNYPWVQLGWDFGEPPRNWDGKLVDVKGTPVDKLPPRPWEYRIDEYLKCLKCLGVEILRWVLLGDCLTYGRTKWLQDNAWQVEDWRLAAGFTDDLAKLLDRIGQYDMKLLPVLLLPSAFWPGRAVAIFKDSLRPLKKNAPGLPRAAGMDPKSWIQGLGGGPRKNGLVTAAAQAGFHKGGRADILTAQGRQKFIDNALTPILKVVSDKKYRDRIHAVEVLTEPELARGPIYPEPKEREKVLDEEPDGFEKWKAPFSQQDVVDFLLATGKEVAAKNLSWTVGFQFFKSLDDPGWKLLDGTRSQRDKYYLRQFHFYDRQAPNDSVKPPVPFPKHPQGPGPVLLGEFALVDPPATKDRDPKGDGRDPAWKVDGVADEVRELALRLAAIGTSGFDTAIGWSVRGTEPELGKQDPRSAWNATIRAAIATNNTGSAPSSECVEKCKETDQPPPPKVTVPRPASSPVVPVVPPRRPP